MYLQTECMALVRSKLYLHIASKVEELGVRVKIGFAYCPKMKNQRTMTNSVRTHRDVREL